MSETGGRKSLKQLKRGVESLKLCPEEVLVNGQKKSEMSESLKFQLFGNGQKKSEMSESLKCVRIVFMSFRLFHTFSDFFAEVKKSLKRKTPYFSVTYLYISDFQTFQTFLYAYGNFALGVDHALFFPCSNFEV
jgi:hypothetical protein